MQYRFVFIFFFLQIINAEGQVFNNSQLLGNNQYEVRWNKTNIRSFTYQLRSGKEITVELPTFAIEGKQVAVVLSSFQSVANPVLLKNGVTEHVFDGAFQQNPSLHLQVTFQVSPDNPVLRFMYRLKTNKSFRLTKEEGKETITYLSFQTMSPDIKEVRFSEFNERFHATHRTEQFLGEQYFTDETSFMGPMAVMEKAGSAFLVAYEHGSQYPDRFLEFHLDKKQTVSLHSVKGNYTNYQEANEFNSIWFEIAGANGSENTLAQAYRTFILKYLSQNKESRKPYIFYNTWGRQERVQWTGQKYLSSMNLNWTLKEIDRAHAMGIEVYVLDAGWFNKTGDWEVNKTFFPDELKQVKAKLDQYGMKLALWFNPVVAAASSNMYEKNLKNRMSWNGKYETLTLSGKQRKVLVFV